MSLRGPQSGGADAGYPEILPAGVLAHSPPLKSLRRHMHRDGMSITSGDKYTRQSIHNFCRELGEERKRKEKNMSRRAAANAHLSNLTIE